MKDLKDKTYVIEKNTLLSSDLYSQTRFQSITQRFLASPCSRKISCPSCGTRIDFQAGLEWVGPDSFICVSCNRLLNISLLHRALHDLGVEHKV